MAETDLQTLRTCVTLSASQKDGHAALDRVAAVVEALAPMKHALEVGDWAHVTEYMEGRDWDALRVALAAAPAPDKEEE